MPYQPIHYISEILKAIKNEPDNNEKLEILKKHDTSALKKFLYLNFNVNVKWLVDLSVEDTYLRKDVPIGMSDTNLYREIKNLYLYISIYDKPGHPKITEDKRNKMFRQVLENMQWEESEALLSLSRKEISTAYDLPLDVVLVMYPNLIPVSADEQVSVVCPVQLVIPPKKKSPGRPKRQ